MRQKRKRLPYILREVGRGKVFWYFRRGKGPRSRLPGEYGSDEFMEAYTAALRGADAPPKKKREEDTLGWLIDQYLSSPDFSSLKESTQAMKTNFLNNLLKRAGIIHLRRLMPLRSKVGEISEQVLLGQQTIF